MKNNKRLKLIDLFSGAGGLTLGFTKVFGRNLEAVWANDFDEAAAATYAANFGNCTSDDIVEVLKKTRAPKADVVIGGPPCQGFSLLNKNKKADPRKELWRPFIEVVLQSALKCSLWKMFLSSRIHPNTMRSLSWLKNMASKQLLRLSVRLSTSTTRTIEEIGVY